MNEFVEKCRREWRRVGVPDPIADDMAAELTADLEEAEAEGASADEVLGAGALDASAFAAAWASERGVIQRPAQSRSGFAWSSPIPLAVAAFALVAIVGTVLVILYSPAQRGMLALPRPEALQFIVVDAPAPSSAAPIVFPSDVSGSGFEINDPDSSSRTVGTVMLIAGLAGIVLLTIWMWVGLDRSLRRRTRIGDRSSGSAY